MSTTVTINQHDTPADLYAALCRAFPESENGGSRWVMVRDGDVTLIFFAEGERPSAESLNDEVDAQHEGEDDPNEGIEVPW